jgi:hypothetical protein
MSRASRSMLVDAKKLIFSPWHREACKGDIGKQVTKHQKMNFFFKCQGRTPRTIRALQRMLKENHNAKKHTNGHWKTNRNKYIYFNSCYPKVLVYKATKLLSMEVLLVCDSPRMAILFCFS